MGIWVHHGSLGTLAYALGVVGFIRGRWVHSRAPWGSWSSSQVVEFTHGRTRGRWVPPGTLNSFARAVEVVVYIWGRLVHSRLP